MQRHTFFYQSIWMFSHWMRKSNERENQRSITGFVCFILLFLCTVCDCIGCWLVCWAQRQLHNWAKSTGLRFRRDKSGERKCATAHSSQTKEILLCAQWLIRKERDGEEKRWNVKFSFQAYCRRSPARFLNEFIFAEEEEGKKFACLFIACSIFPRNIVLAFISFFFCFQFGECLFVYTRNHFSLRRCCFFFGNTTLFSASNWDCNFLNL